LALLLGFADAARAASWTALAQGRSGAYAWRVQAERGERSGVCLRVSVLYRHSPFSFERSRFRSCDAPGSELRAAAAPLFAGGAQLGGGGPGLSVFAALFAPAVRSAWLGLEAGGVGVPVRGLETGEATGLGLGRAGLGVVVLEGGRCATRAISRGAGGAALWDSGAELGCGAFEAGLGP
jgi:hypothetical protein